MPRLGSWAAFALFFPLGQLLAACSQAAPTTLAPTGGSSTPNQSVTVFAAASLTEPLNELAAQFSKEMPGAKVVYNFDGSQQLRTQLENGAKADVFASANGAEMGKARTAGLVITDAPVFARNKLVIIVPKANPGRINEPNDLAKPIKLISAGKDVPIGGYFLDMLDNMSADPAYGSGFKQDVLKNVISEETNVKQVVAKVQLGEADAGVVYSTDVGPNLAKDVLMITIPDQFNVIASYPIAPLKAAAEPALALRFVEFVIRDEGQAALKKYGFITNN